MADQSVKYISSTEYAKQVGLSHVTIKHKCVAGNIPGAIKVANRWLIPEGTPYVDLRFKAGGKYSGTNPRNKKPKEIPLEEYKKIHGID